MLSQQQISLQQQMSPAPAAVIYAHTDVYAHNDDDRQATTAAAGGPSKTVAYQMLLQAREPRLLSLLPAPLLLPTLVLLQLQSCSGGQLTPAYI
jgi:hypothetical protein